MRIDGVGLCEEAGGAGEVPGAGRINAGEGDAGRSQRPAQQLVVMAGRLKQDKYAAAGPACDQNSNRLRQVVDAVDGADAAIKNVKVMFGDIDSDKARMYLHDAYPCAARSGAKAVSINCSGLG